MGSFVLAGTTELFDSHKLGTDTMAATLTSLFWELAQHVEWQDKIRTELASISNDFTDDIPQWKAISTSTALDAVIREGLRIHGAVPGSLYREVPSGGRMIAGHFVPQGVINRAQYSY